MFFINNKYFLKNILMNNLNRLLLVLLISFSCTEKKATLVSEDTNQHPNLILTNKSISEIKSHLGNIPVFDKTLEIAKLEVDAAIEK